jgi:hypothetical protein
MTAIAVTITSETSVCGTFCLFIFGDHVRAVNGGLADCEGDTPFPLFEWVNRYISVLVTGGSARAR